MNIKAKGTALAVLLTLALAGCVTPTPGGKGNNTQIFVIGDQDFDITAGREPLGHVKTGRVYYFHMMPGTVTFTARATDGDSVSLTAKLDPDQMADGRTAKWWCMLVGPTPQTHTLILRLLDKATCQHLVDAGTGGDEHRDQSRAR